MTKLTTEDRKLLYNNMMKAESPKIEDRELTDIEEKLIFICKAFDDLTLRADKLEHMNLVLKDHIEVLNNIHFGEGKND